MQEHLKMTSKDNTKVITYKRQSKNTKEREQTIKRENFDCLSINRKVRQKINFFLPIKR
jgi:hypothetical protein